MANSVDPDQMLHSAASDLGLHCLLRLASQNTLGKYRSPALQKYVFGHMLTEKAQISLCIHAVWSGPSLSAARIIEYYRMYQWRAKSWIRPCAWASWCESAHFAHTQRHFFAWRGQYNSKVFDLPEASISSSYKANGTSGSVRSEKKAFRTVATAFTWMSRPVISTLESEIQIFTIRDLKHFTPSADTISNSK